MWYLPSAGPNQGQSVCEDGSAIEEFARIIMTSAGRKFLHLAVGAATLPAVMRIANAQTYPKRSVTMVVTYRAGSGSDVLARLIGPSLSEFLGQHVIIENVVGAGGITWGYRVARAASDGYQFVHGGTDTFTQSQIALRKSRLGAMP
jgi:tripartite-type tricarboxylate transporter receptor subunit TctC